MGDYKKLKKCLCCDSLNMKMILDLGKQPLANSYHNEERLKKYPLQLNLCEKCFHLQLSHAVNPNLMFKNYLYVSGTSNTLRKYFDDFSDIVLNYNMKAKNILDIACNDGSQLDSFKKRNLKTYGIDPASNLYEISSNKGHNIVLDYFNADSIKLLNESKFDIITAQNVFAHNTYPLKFLKLCKKILSKKGNLFIQTSQSNMIQNNEFDTIYHEHISFFNVLSMSILVERSGLYLNDVFKTDVHGTSFVFVISKNNKISDRVNEEMKKFKDLKLNELLTYIDYSNNAKKVTNELKDFLSEYKNKGYKLIGYGAAAKGNTLLNFGHIKLDYILDDNPMKHNLKTPGMNIKIISPNDLISVCKNKPIVFVPLAWNFYDEIKSKIKSIVDKDKNLFIKYFPKLQIDY